MASGKQLDRQELKARLNAANELLIAYGDLANTHHADNTELEALKGLIERIENWENGSNTNKNASKGCAPIIALTAPADIVMSSGEATAITTGTNLDIVTQQSTQITAGKNFVARVKERISLFVHKFGIKIIAASGRVEIQAHSDNIEMTAQKKLILVALEETLLKAPKVTIITDGASYEIGAGGIITKTIGTHTRHAAKHQEVGPASTVLDLPALPVSLTPDSYSQRINFAHMIGYQPGEETMLAQVPYEVRDKQGKLVASGVTDSHGLTQRIVSHDQKDLVCWLGDGDWKILGDQLTNPKT